MRTIGNKVLVSPHEVYVFNLTWPCSKLRSTRSYWFDFDSEGNLVDTDCPESDDGSESVSMADDCKAFLFDDVLPPWANQ